MSFERKMAKPKDPVAEAAGAKIWAVYVAEAEKYDKSLIESWKSNMEGMLIFAGLFSASLTAFLIESYKTLNPDATVQLLTQISLQLSESSNPNGIPSVPAFTPSTSALVCNALWFTSLGLSLSCALVATLLEQWARDFIHRSEVKSSPIIRARVFSFLYYGLRRFSLHSVVDIIPLLLHAALLLFLAGLVAFLIPVNIPMAVLLRGVYTILTFHPLLYLDSPYRTPLSGLFWPLFHQLERRWRRRPDGSTQTVADEPILDAIIREAIEPSEAMSSRDGKALLWTVRSLSDEVELEPFVQAIPRTLWGLGVQRDTYSAHFRELVLNPGAALYARIRGLLDSCDTGMLSLEARRSRLIMSYQALWSIATLFVSRGPEPLPFPDLSPLPMLGSPTGAAHDIEIRKVSISAGVLIQWIHFQTLRSTLSEYVRKLVGWQELVLRGHEPDLSPLTKLLADLSLRLEYDWPSLHLIKFQPQKGAAELIPQLFQLIDFILRTTPHNIWFGYIALISDLNSLPAYFSHNLGFIQLPVFPPELRPTLTATMSKIVDRQLEDFNGEEHGWMDELLLETKLIPLCLEQAAAEHPMALPRGIIQYLRYRRSDAAVFSCVGVEEGVGRSVDQREKVGYIPLAAMIESLSGALVLELLMINASDSNSDSSSRDTRKDGIGRARCPRQTRAKGSPCLWRLDPQRAPSW
ncbi:hypothetical protein K438DRAFT_1936036 [Mycena galopus ATCC 62051]|nr:hypothetical protein K438DRAFT_1936036 [Mycena galopus ATCC 62051]